MEGMLTFTGIIIIVFGILQIILFFKIWGMTNDVKCLKNRFVNIDETEIIWQIRKLLLKGDKRKAEDLLFNYFMQQLKIALKLYDSESFVSSKAFDNRLTIIKNEFKKYYSQINVPFPSDLENLNTLEDIESIFKL